MSRPEERREGMTGSALRLYRGDENELDVEAVADEFEDEPSSKRSAEEVEAYWAGRLPANRISARVAA